MSLHMQHNKKFTNTEYVKKILTWNANFIWEKHLKKRQKETVCKMNTAYNRMDNNVIHLST